LKNSPREANYTIKKLKKKQIMPRRGQLHAENSLKRDKKKKRRVELREEREVRRKIERWLGSLGGNLNGICSGRLR